MQVSYYLRIVRALAFLSRLADIGLNVHAYLAQCLESMIDTLFEEVRPATATSQRKLDVGVVVVYTMADPLRDNLLRTFVYWTTGMKGHAVVHKLFVRVHVGDEYSHPRFWLDVNMSISEIGVSTLFRCCTAQTKYKVADLLG